MMVRFHIVTLFPGMFTGPFDISILKRAREDGLVQVFLYNIRDYTHDRHHVVDDYPYGGGYGMVLKPEPIFEAVDAVKLRILQFGESTLVPETPIVLLTPQGRLFSQRIAREMADQKDIILLCGHYEGIDERVSQYLATDEVSIGDYVLTGGEIPAMVFVDAVARMIPGVLGSLEAIDDESHGSGLLEYPQYTRPSNFRGLDVPDILLSGNHQRIAQWRREKSMSRTWQRRPDLLDKRALDLGKQEHQLCP